MNQIPFNAKEYSKIKDLITKKYYVGNISQNQFLIKRNFGVRRLIVKGQVKDEQILVTVQNEMLHQIFLILSQIVLLLLIIITLIQSNYLISLVLTVIFILIIITNIHQKRKEIKHLKTTLEKL